MPCHARHTHTLSLSPVSEPSNQRRPFPSSSRDGLAEPLLSNQSHPSPALHSAASLRSRGDTEVRIIIALSKPIASLRLQRARVSIIINSSFNREK